MLISFLSILFLLAEFSFCPYINQDYHLSIIHVCYQSLNDPKLFYSMMIKFPSAPLYILSDIEYYLVPLNTSLDPIVDWVTHHLRLVDGDCDGRLQISDDGIKFKALTIRINTYLDYYRLSPFLDFYYDFDQDFKYDLFSFNDTHRDAYLFLNFVHGKKHLPHTDDIDLHTIMPKLKTKAVQSNHLCVMAAGVRFIIKSDFNRETDISHITGIVARVYQNDKEEAYVTWTAYGCSSRSSYIPERLHYIVSKLDSHTELIFTPRFIDSERGAYPMTKEGLKKEVKISTSDIILKDFSKLEKLPKEDRKVFIMDLDKHLEECPGHDDQYGYLTKARSRLYGYRYEDAYCSLGVKMKAWKYLNAEEKCPAA